MNYPIEYIVTVIALFIIITYLLINSHIVNKRHEQREDDLMDRLMSRNFSEYAYGSKVLSEQIDKVDSVNEQLKPDEGVVRVD